MTDARERLARFISGAPFPSARSRAKAEALLSMMNLSPSAASALMDSTAVVVPVEPTDEQCEAVFRQLDRKWEALKGDERYPTIRFYHRAVVAASPYRSSSDDNK